MPHIYCDCGMLSKIMSTFISRLNAMKCVKNDLRMLHCYQILRSWSWLSAERHLRVNILTIRYQRQLDSCGTNAKRLDSQFTVSRGRNCAFGHLLKLHLKITTIGLFWGGFSKDTIGIANECVFERLHLLSIKKY